MVVDWSRAMAALRPRICDDARGERLVGILLPILNPALVDHSVRYRNGAVDEIHSRDDRGQADVTLRNGRRI
jgi:hypothetical protein